MSDKYLKAFLAVEKHLSFSLAAEELGIPQTTLTKQIKALEQEVGAVLFQRSARRVALTKAGVHFSLHAKAILNKLDDMYQSMKANSADQMQSITLASVPVVQVYHMTEMLAAFRNAYPDIRINITQNDTSIILRLLISGQADVAFVGIYSFKGIPIKSYVLMEDELVLIIGRNHRFSDRETISLSEAAEEKFLLLNVATNVFILSYDYCIQAGFVPNVINPEPSRFKIETIIDLVSKGFGVALLMYKAVEHYTNQEIKIIRLAEKPIMPFGLITRDEPVSEVCRLFVQFAVDYFAGTDK